MTCDYLNPDAHDEYLATRLLTGLGHTTPMLRQHQQGGQTTPIQRAPATPRRPLPPVTHQPARVYG